MVTSPPWSSLIGDMLTCFNSEWDSISTNNWVLSMVRSDCVIQFHSLPHPLSLYRDPSHETLLLERVQSLLALGTVEEVPLLHLRLGFYSWYFLVPKLNGGMRPIIESAISTNTSDM